MAEQDAVIKNKVIEELKKRTKAIKENRCDTAYNLNIHPNNLCAILNGSRDISFKIAFKIKQKYGIDTGLLYPELSSNSLQSMAL